jgi:hypothetical protein
LVPLLRPLAASVQGHLPLVRHGVSVVSGSLFDSLLRWLYGPIEVTRKWIALDRAFMVCVGIVAALVWSLR